MVGSFDEDMIELMDGRMDGWMNIEWMASSYIEDMIELMDEWMNISWMVGSFIEDMIAWMAGWIKIWMNGRFIHWVYDWMYGLTSDYIVARTEVFQDGRVDISLRSRG